MADATTTTTDDKVALNVPPEAQEKFGELVELIKASSSMDMDEKQYWVDVLLIMSDDQIINLRGILDNEKKQLETAAQKYSSGMETAVKNVAKKFDEAAYNEKKRIRREAERKQEEKERLNEENILKELENL